MDGSVGQGAATHDDTYQVTPRKGGPVQKGTSGLVIPGSLGGMLGALGLMGVSQGGGRALGGGKGIRDGGWGGMGMETGGFEVVGGGRVVVEGGRGGGLRR